MNEGEVKELAKKWLEKQGFKVREEVAIGENREVVLDFFSYSDASHQLILHQPLFPHATSGQIAPHPIILWVECKGDENLSQLLEGFIRVEFAIFDRGGLGILAIPHNATEKLLKYKNFLKNNAIALLNVESNQILSLK